MRQQRQQRPQRTSLSALFAKAWNRGGLREAQNVLCRIKQRNPKESTRAEMAFHATAQ